jgi:hypothetical protein
VVPRPTVVIDDPKEGDRVLREIIMEGRWSNLPSGQVLWVLGGGTDGGFYPQDGPVLKRENGTWQSPTIYVTRYTDPNTERDAGNEFNYTVVAVSERVAQQFAELRKSYGSLKQLPENAAAYDSVTVTR